MKLTLGIINLCCSASTADPDSLPEQQVEIRDGGSRWVRKPEHMSEVCISDTTLLQTNETHSLGRTMPEDMLCGDGDRQKLKVELVARGADPTREEGAAFILGPRGQEPARVAGQRRRVSVAAGEQSFQSFGIATYMLVDAI